MTLFLFRKKKTCAKRKINFFGKAFFFKERFAVAYLVQRKRRK